MSEFTAIQIRGKRKGLENKPTRSLKRHKAVDVEFQPTSKLILSQDKPSSPQRPRSRAPELSDLEKLPLEILEYIFQYSGNVDFPLASMNLTVRLKSKLLYKRLTTHTLYEIRTDSVSSATRSRLLAARRLMNSKFFTWSFFCEWLHQEFERLLKDNVHPGELAMSVSNGKCGWAWSKLHFDPRLLPPQKLLVGPFTSDKVRFLKFLASYFRGDLDQLDPIYRELAREGLDQAVREANGFVCSALSDLGVEPNTETLRKAIVGSRHWSKELIKGLTDRICWPTLKPVDIDFLDPVLWSWAERAKEAGNEKGPWLMNILKISARTVNSSLRPIHPANLNK